MGTSISISSSGAVAPTPAYLSGDLLTSGEEAMPRSSCSTASTTTTSGTLRFTFFTARKSETTTQVKVVSGGTAAGATPTLIRIGLYTIAADGAGTLVASTANDTTLLAGMNTAYTKAWQAGYAKVAGQRFALGILIVTGAATPSLVGSTLFGPSTEYLVEPKMSGTISGQADLPASFLGASVGASSTRFYAAILP